MLVTKIEEITKSKSKVYLEEEFSFVLYKGELYSYGIQENAEIAPGVYEEIRYHLLPRRAKLYAMNLLKSREYTTKQLEDKLKKAGYPQVLAEEAIAYVESFHYVDDLRYAETYISDHENTRSRRRIEMDLFRRGISQETLQKAWENWEKQGGTQDEQDMIRVLLEKKKYNPQEADLKEKQRLFGFLLRKGFSGEQVRKALDIT